jgi:hypothetical protein
MQPEDKFHRGRSGKYALTCLTVNFTLHSYMRRGLQLEVTTLFIYIQLSSERALDVPRSSVMTLDQVAVIGIHDAHEVGEVAGGAGGGQSLP